MLNTVISSAPIPNFAVVYITVLVAICAAVGAAGNEAA